MPFENLVRPFQLPRTAPGQRVYVATTEPEVVRVTPGRTGGSVKSFSGSFSYEQTFYAINTQIEQTDAGGP